MTRRPPQEPGRPPEPEPLRVAVADSHCHLEMDPFPVGEALAAAARVGVTRVVQIGTDLAESRRAVDLAARHGALVAGVALHPNEAPRLAAAGRLDDALAEIAGLAAHPAVRAVGETGLDYYRTGPEGRAAQHESFRAHVALAGRLDRTLVIHDRDAHDDVLRLLEEEGAPPRVVFHCFSGDAAMARVCADRGWFLSFAGTVTFKANDALRAALAATPRELVLVETDAPFLTPVPYRGRPNASYLVPVTLRAMAAVRGEGEDELAAAVDANTDRAFGGRW